MIDQTSMAGQGGNVAPKWTVTRVEDTIAPSLTNPGQRVKRIYFRLFDGTESYVDVPLQGFTKEAVVQAVDTHANELISVIGLKSPEQY